MLTFQRSVHLCPRKKYLSFCNFQLNLQIGFWDLKSQAPEMKVWIKVSDYASGHCGNLNRKGLALC